MNVQEIMTKNVYCIGLEDSLNAAAQLMWEHDCGSVPVIGDEKQVVGMITDRDIAMAAYIRGDRLEDIPISSARSERLICCTVDDDIKDVQQLMQAYQVHRIPVVDDSGEPLGIISINDIACAYKGGTKGLQAKAISDTLAAICEPMKLTSSETAAAA